MSALDLDASHPALYQRGQQCRRQLVTGLHQHLAVLLAYDVLGDDFPVEALGMVGVDRLLRVDDDPLDAQSLDLRH